MEGTSLILTRSVATLITLAGDESGHPGSFRTILLAQIEDLKSQIGKDDDLTPANVQQRSDVRSCTTVDRPHEWRQVTLRGTMA